MRPATSGQFRFACAARRRLLAVVATFALGVAGTACTKIESVLIGVPVLVPNPATAGTWVRVTVALIDKAGCGQASISVNYNNADRPVHLVSVGGTYTDSIFASLTASNIKATGICGDAIQTQSNALTVTP